MQSSISLIILIVSKEIMRKLSMKRLSLILSITSILGFYGVSPGLAQDFIPQDFIPKTYSLGGFPRATSLTDIDNDGDLDIALTNPNNHNIAILLNRGDGTFEMGNDYPPTIPIDGYPIAIISKDIDGDSDIDLVVLDSSGGIRTLFNEGELKFSQGGRYPSESYSFSISPSDVDLDGDWDIIVSSAKRTTVLLNDGTGRFNTNLIHPGGTNSDTYITTDLNLDDRDDIVIGDREGISVLLNNGDDTFARGVEYLTGKTPIAVVAGDIDSDLYPDLIVANYKSHTISILKNNRDGTFQEAVNYPSGKGPNSIALGDVDKDEDMDVVVTNGLSGDLSIFINNTVKPLSVATDSLPQGRRGLYYSARLEAKGGVPPYKWAVVSGSLPPTLYLDPLTGEMVSISHRGLPSEQISGRVEGGETQHEGHEDMGEPLKSFEPPCYCLKAPRGLYRFTVQVTDSTSSAATASIPPRGLEP